MRPTARSQTHNLPWMPVAALVRRLLQLAGWTAVPLASALLLCASFGLDPFHDLTARTQDSRPTLLTWGLAALDPSLRRLVLNTLLFALLVTFPAAALGLALTEWRVRSGPWIDRTISVATRPAILPPLIVGLGLRGLVPIDTLANGLLLLAASWLWAIPLISAVIRPARAAVDPRWRDRGRLYGGSRGIRRAWHFEVWPVVGPPLVRVSALVFLLACLEVGSPLALNVDNLLAPQALASIRGGSPALASVLALSAWAFGGIVVAAGFRAFPYPLRPSRSRPESTPANHRATTLARAAETILLVLLILVWWLPLLRLALGLLARLGREAMEGETLMIRLYALADATRDLPLGLARDTLLGALPLALSIAASTLLLALGLNTAHPRPRLWHSRGISLIPGLILGLAAASLAPPDRPLSQIPALLAFVILAIPLALAHLPPARSHASQAERERLLGASRFGVWWRIIARPLVACLIRAAVAVTLFVLADTTASLALATTGVDPNPGSSIARSIAHGGDPDLAPVLSLVLVLLLLTASALGVRVAWYGPYPASPSRSGSNSRTIMS